jgi:hypothetical protein
VGDKESERSLADRILRVLEVRPERQSAADRGSNVIDLTDRAMAARSALGPSAFEDGCGPGNWCAACREEIRQEALAWLRDLNATAPQWGTAIAEVRQITGDDWTRPS